MSTSETRAPRRRFGFSFGLGHLLTLMAGFGIGMAIMQPWKSWERPPAPVDYDVAVVSITDTVEVPSAGDPGKTIREMLLGHFKPGAQPSGELPFGKILGVSALSTIEGEAGIMEVSLQLQGGNTGAVDKFKIQVKPYSVRGLIRTGITSEFSWLPNSAAPTEKIVTQKPSVSDAYELAKHTSPDGKEEERLFVVLTPRDATKRQFTLKPTTARAGTKAP